MSIENWQDELQLEQIITDIEENKKISWDELTLEQEDYLLEQALEKWREHR